MVRAALILKRRAEDLVTVAYPSHLPTFLKASKSRTQPASFRMAEPRRGYAYTQEIGTDTPVFWDVTWRFTRSQAAQFKLWFEVSIRRGVDEFTMPIDTEFGLIEHVCKFLPDNLLPTQDTGSVWTYSATIMARALVIPQDYIDAADLIVGLPGWSVFAGALDEAMTVELPIAATPPVPTLLDLFTAANGTDPTGRDMDMHPTSVARWSDYGPPSSPGLIQDNALSLDGSVVLYHRAPSGEYLTTLASVCLVMTVTVPAGGVFDASASLLYLTDEVSSSMDLRVDAVGKMTGNVTTTTGYFTQIENLGVGTHTVALWTSSGGSAMAANGAQIGGSALDNLLMGSLSYLEVQISEDAPTGYTIGNVAVYQGISFDQAVSLTV